MNIIYYLFTIITFSDYSQIIANATVYYAIAQVFYTIFTMLILIVGWRQLSNLNKNLRINSLTTMIDLERELNNRLDIINNISLGIQRESIRNPVIANVQISFHERETQVAIQNYLNVLDRICFCIINEYIKESEWRSEYLLVVIEAVDNNEDFFSNITDYSNILNLYNKWRS
jgi:hypothetical protein